MWWGIASHNKRQNRGCQRCDENTHNTTNKRKTIRRKVGGQGAKAAIALRKHVLMSRDATQPFAHSRCRPLFFVPIQRAKSFHPMPSPTSSHHSTPATHEALCPLFSTYVISTVRLGTTLRHFNRDDRGRRKEKQKNVILFIFFFRSQSENFVLSVGKREQSASS